MKKRFQMDTLETENLSVLINMAVDPNTPENIRVQIIGKILEGAEGENFFASIFKEKLSFGECPNCGHANHWAIPEEELNKMGWAAHEEDRRVPRHNDIKSCPKWQQSCAKKRITV